MKIGIIGAGNIGGNLGKVWAAKGHEIAFGVREPQGEKIQALLADIAAEHVQAMSVAEAGAFGEVLVIAVPWAAVRQVISELGDVGGKIIIDTTNRLGVPAPEDGNSAAEDIAKMLPSARVFKAFNTMGWETLLDPVFSGQKATAFICGDDADAKSVVMSLAGKIGLDVVDAGPLSNASALEGMTKLWIGMMRLYGREIAFTIVKR